jgi:hypothetical protein
MLILSHQAGMQRLFVISGYLGGITGEAAYASVARQSEPFGADDFHNGCDGHANTMTMILDTEGNIFGGFTPVEWETRPWHNKADSRQQTFLFTLKNPHNSIR